MDCHDKDDSQGLKAKAGKPMLGSIQRQASLPAAPNSPQRSSAAAAALLKKMKKPPMLVRMNSDSDLQIQPMSSEEERVLDTLDEIDLLHNIAKTPNLLGGSGANGAKNAGGLLKVPGSSAGQAAGSSGGSGGPAVKDKRKLVKQKSLNRTLSTSVLRIKKKRCAFWDTA